MDLKYYLDSFYEEDEFYEPPEWGFNYLSISHDDMLNGDGLRTVLWVSGCSHSCPGCQNAFSWDGSFGREFTEETKAELFSYLSKEYVQGVTFSGGDPLFSRNRVPLGSLAREIKALFPSKDLWVYTGYSLDYIRRKGFYFKETAPWKSQTEEFLLDWLGFIDVLVDGPFMADVRKRDLAEGRDPEWCGSSNQRVIDVKGSLKAKKIVEKGGVK